MKKRESLKPLERGKEAKAERQGAQGSFRSQVSVRSQEILTFNAERLVLLGRELLHELPAGLDAGCSCLDAGSLCLQRYSFGSADGRDLERSFLGVAEVMQEGLTKLCAGDDGEGKESTVFANILRPKNILQVGMFSHDVETGLRTWPSAHFMAEVLARHPSMIPQGPVLELGSGLGMLGCVLRRVVPSATPVVLTDLKSAECPQVVNYLTANARLNQRKGSPLVVEELCWGESHIAAFKTKLQQKHQVDIASSEGFRCILGCDLGVDSVFADVAPDLIDTIDLLLSRDSMAVMYLTYVDRCKKAGEQFLENLRSRSFDVKELDLIDLCTSSEGTALQNTENRPQTAPKKNRPRRRIWLSLLIEHLGMHLVCIRRKGPTPTGQVRTA